MQPNLHCDMEPVIDLTKDSDPGSDSSSDSDVMIMEDNPENPNHGSDPTSNLDADPEENPMTELDYTTDVKPQYQALVEAAQQAAFKAGKSRAFQLALKNWAMAPTNRRSHTIKGESKAIQALHHAALLGQGKDEEWKAKVCSANALRPPFARFFRAS